MYWNLLRSSWNFDTVGINKLLYKLRNVGTRHNALNLIESCITDTVEKIPSDCGDMKYGAPQGTVLGPTLFLVRVNEIIDLRVHWYVMLMFC